jgi:hypothetical protein
VYRVLHVLHIGMTRVHTVQSVRVADCAVAYCIYYKYWGI